LNANIQPLRVLKFGSSVLRTEDDIPAAVHEIYRFLRKGARVLAVVSAFGGTTDLLLGKARGLAGDPEPSGLAALLATGEQTSAALLALGLARAGVPARVLDPGTAGPFTRGALLDAEPADLDAAAVRRAFAEASVVVLPGFVGRTAAGDTSLLGRGGSDLTAFFAAARLGAASVRLVKDVDGIYEKHPATPGARPRRFETLGWEDALRLGSVVVQPKALRFARSHNLAFEVAGLNGIGGTRVGPVPTRGAPAPRSREPLRVALLGLGVVGQGVYSLLSARPEDFRITACAVRDSSRPRDVDVPRELLFTSPGDALSRPCDVVVEAMGRLEPASILLARAAEQGIDVVTANKELVALQGPTISRRALLAGSRFLYSACVGGGLPVLETLRHLGRKAELRGIRGILNGTTNFVIDRLAEGYGFTEAVDQARRLGFAEADPTADLDGSDAAWKLVILAREALGIQAGPGRVSRRGIEGLSPEGVRRARKAGKVFRLVARCRRKWRGADLRVGPEALGADDPLARTADEGNSVVLELADGREVVLRGKGAGRWPTAESVFGDILEVARGQRCAVPEEICTEPGGWRSRHCG
jgi:homoserine dehydrogenase